MKFILVCDFNGYTAIRRYKSAAAAINDIRDSQGNARGEGFDATLRLFGSDRNVYFEHDHGGEVNYKVTAFIQKGEPIRRMDKNDVRFYKKAIIDEKRAKTVTYKVQMPADWKGVD